MAGGFRRVYLYIFLAIALVRFVYGIENISLYQSNPLNPKPLINSIPEIINFQIKDKNILIEAQRGFQYITIKGLDLINNSGLPNLPFKTYEIPIYGNLEFFNISVNDINYQEIDLEKDIVPCAQRNLSEYHGLQENILDDLYEKYGKPGELRKNELVYNSEEYFPNKLVSANSGYDRDHNKFIYIRFYPVQYNPIKKKLIIIKNAKIKVTYGLVKEASIRKVSEASISSTSGYLWYPDIGDNKIYKMDINGNLQSNFSSPLYPVGITFDSTYLWISTPTDIYKYDTSGNEITHFSLDLFVSGGDLTWGDGYLWMVGYNDIIYKMDATNGRVITQFYAPSSSPEGITFDGTYFWISDGYTYKIYKVRKTDYGTESSFDVPGTYITPRSLAWDGSNLWLHIVSIPSPSDRFYKLAPNGTEIYWFASPTDDPTGLTWQPTTTQQCLNTDTSCGTYPNCVNCNNQDGCSGNYYRNYYCVSNSQGCSYTSDNCNDCSCSCGGYNTPETTTNNNCNDGKDNDCDGKTDSADSGCQQQCTSGPCCDLSTNKFKSNGAQPTGYTDDTNGLCSGSSNSETTCSNSSTTTCYVLTKDYYCNGSDANAQVSYTLKDTCGTCEYCTNNDLTCNYYSSSNICGTKDCDYLDVTCRKYYDVNRYCSGTSGTCNDANCNSYTNAQKGTSCGTGKECDGNGNCIGTQQCTPGTACCDNNGNFKPSTTVCRAASGDCDLEEKCTGSSETCPTDSVRPSSYICRASAGGCDNTEKCDGTNKNCPPDTFKPSTTICRASSGVCDLEEKCTGSFATCPVNSYKPKGTTCGTNKECDGNGNCVEVEHCDNKIKDYDEEGIDCGGSCPNQDCCNNDHQDKNLGEEGVDCGGACMSCVCINTNTKFAPSDTVCNSIWPSHEGEDISINEHNYACDLFEVCDENLDYIIEEAQECCLNGCSGNCHSTCDLAYKTYSYLDKDYSDAKLKKCMALYIIYGLGPSAKFMQKYYYPELRCGGTIPLYDCSHYQAQWLKFWDKGIYYPNTDLLTCQGIVGQPNGWASDTNFQENSCIFSDLPAHVSINKISTGTCVDYSTALTTLLRKAGYSSTEVYSIKYPPPDKTHSGHEFNLIKFPGDKKWTIVDTSGNYNNPYNPGRLPSGSPYCTYYDKSCSNDNGEVACPNQESIYGCEENQKGIKSFASNGEEESSPKKVITIINNSLIITKTLPEWIRFGSNLRVNITILNNDSIAKNISIKEIVENALPVSPTEFFEEDLPPDLIATLPPFYYWNFSLEPNKSKEILYEIKPLLQGVYIVRSTEVYVRNKTIYVNQSIISVLCNNNTICEPVEGENHFNCISDCPSGFADGICDLQKDDVCDPDCTEGIDPDCPPVIKILSPVNNTTYRNGSVDLNWTLDKDVDWCGYSLDDNVNKTNIEQISPK